MAIKRCIAINLYVFEFRFKIRLLQTNKIPKTIKNIKRQASLKIERTSQLRLWVSNTILELSVQIELGLNRIRHNSIIILMINYFTTYILTYLVTRHQKILNIKSLSNCFFQCCQHLHLDHSQLSRRYLWFGVSDWMFESVYQL